MMMMTMMFIHIIIRIILINAFIIDVLPRRKPTDNDNETDNLEHQQQQFSKVLV